MRAAPSAVGESNVCAWRVTRDPAQTGLSRLERRRFDEPWHTDRNEQNMLYGCFARFV